MALHLTGRRFTVDQYHQMGQAEILDEDDRLELIDGEIVEMTPIGRRHAAAMMRLHELLLLRLGDVVLVSGQNPIRLGDHSEPQPDLALLRRRVDFYASALPTPKDILLLIEVAETSADVDRNVKAPLYAANGIGEFWLVDVNQESITVYREPDPSGYHTIRVMHRGEDLAPAVFPARALSVADLLG